MATHAVPQLPPELYQLIFAHLAREGDKETLRKLAECSRDTSSIAAKLLWGKPFKVELYDVMLLLPVKEKTDTNSKICTFIWDTSKDSCIGEGRRDYIRTLCHRAARLDFPGKYFEVAPGILECLFEIFRNEDGTRPLFDKLEEIVAQDWPRDASSLLSALNLSRVPLSYISRQGAADSKRNPISLEDDENRWPSLWSESLQELEIYDPTKNEVEATAHLSSLRKLAIVYTENSSLANSFSGLKGSSELFALTRMEVCCHSGGTAISFLSLVPLNCPDFRSLEITTFEEGADTNSVVIIESLAERLGSSEQPSLQELLLTINALGQDIGMEGLYPLAKFKSLRKLCIYTRDDFSINDSALLEFTSQFKFLEKLSFTFRRKRSHITFDVLPELIDNLEWLKDLGLGFNFDSLIADSKRLPIRAVKSSRPLCLRIDPVTSSPLGGEDQERIAAFLCHLLPGINHRVKPQGSVERKSPWGRVLKMHRDERKRQGPRCDKPEFVDTDDEETLHGRH